MERCDQRIPGYEVSQEMTEDILDAYARFLRREYRKENTQSNYHRFTRAFLHWIQTNKHKNHTELTSEDTKDYKTYCVEQYSINGNVARLNAVNNFVDEFLGKPELRITAPKPRTVNKPVLSSEEIELYKKSAITPLEQLIVIYQLDGLLRPSEFYKLRISNHDIENQILYLSDTKTGDNTVILTPNMIKAFKRYLPFRIEPKHKQDSDLLIIIDKGSHYGLAPSEQSDFIYRTTKKIAARAGFKRSIYPYLIKPSAITEEFNQQVNPRIIQRQARHKNIETTLRYDHTSDKMARDYFNKQQQVKIDISPPEEKARIWLEKFLKGEIDMKTFKTGLDVLLPSKRKEEDLGYA
jgi:integrase/recombinase XerD